MPCKKCPVVVAIKGLQSTACNCSPQKHSYWWKTDFYMIFPLMHVYLALHRRNLHDPSLSVSVQCTSVRLLLNLVEVVFSRRADHRMAESYRCMLAGILDAFTSKLAALHRRLPQLLHHREAHVPSYFPPL
jgi:hypothetical protein